MGRRLGFTFSRRSAAGPARNAARPDIFAGWWLSAFGAALATLYLVYFIILYRAGVWIVDRAGVPIYTDFGCGWAAAIAALHGDAVALSDPAAFARIQAALFPAARGFYPHWPYPPTFLLAMAPFALMPYRAAFILWDALTLASLVAVVWRIARHRTAIALALAAPFTAWNLLAAQNGFLTAALIGAALVTLERRPLLSGMFLGILSYKPQFGILFPLALVAGREWRAIAAAAAAALLLAVLSALLFGIGAWAVFPRELAAQTGLNFLSGENAHWGYLQSLYGLVRGLHGGGVPAWLAQGALTTGLAVVVWQLWRSRLRHALKAAALAAAALLATPYAFAYDMTVLVVAAAFLAADQLERGLLPGDKAFWIALFGVPLALLVTLGDNAQGPTFGGVPVGLAAAVALFAAVLRRALSRRVGAQHQAASAP